MEIPFYPLDQINVLNQCPDAELIDLKEAFLRSRQDVYGAHRHDYFETFFFTQGRGTIRVDFQDYPIQAPGFLLIFPGQLHQWFLDDIPEGLILRFIRSWVDPPTLQLLGVGQSRPELIPLGGAEVQDFASLEHLLRRAFQHHDCAALPVIRPLVNLWLVHYALAVQAAVPKDLPSAGNLSRRFLDLVEQKYPLGLKIPSFARELGVSESRLFSVIKRELGQSPGDILRQRLLLEARRLLAVTDLSVNEISWNLGFEDPAYFSRFFRESLGVTPSVYRQQEIAAREKS